MITFNNKTTLNSQPDIANENKVTASDMNEIKSVYNNEIGDVSNLITTATNVVDAINEVNGKIKSANITGTTNQNGEVNVTDFNSNFTPSTILILSVKVLDKIPFITTNSTGTTLFVGFRNRGTTYSPVSNGTSISFAIYYIEI